MKGFVGGSVDDCVDRVSSAGPLSTDNPIVEVVAVTAAAALLLYAGYKILNDKDAAENVSTVFGTKADKET